MCTNNHALYTRLVMNRLFLGLQSKCIRWYLCMDAPFNPVVVSALTSPVSNAAFAATTAPKIDFLAKASTGDSIS